MKKNKVSLWLITSALALLFLFISIGSTSGLTLIVPRLTPVITKPIVERPVVKPPVLSNSNSMVIVTNSGEVNKDTRFKGDKIKYKIYYQNTATQEAKITITDTLESSLSEVNVLNNGTFDRATNTVTWILSKVAANQKGFVEFEALAAKIKLVRNKAAVTIDQQNPVDTNSTEVNIVEAPPIGWVRFMNTPVGAKPTANMKDETTSDTMVNFDIPGMYVHEVKVNGITNHRLSIPGQGNTQIVGKPEVPIIGRLIEVPFGVNFNLEIFKSKFVTLKNYNIYPAQKPEPRLVKAPVTLKPINTTRFSGNSFFPGDLAVIKAEEIGVVRGHRLIFLKINPIQYNPATKEMRAYSNIEVKINYNRPAQITAVNKKIMSGPFENLLRYSVLNYKDPGRFIRKDIPNPKESGCDYLILTHSSFYNAADQNNPLVRLKDWKQRKGLRTKIVAVDTLTGGNTADNIKTYLKNAYTGWQIVPSYVLLVGDSEFIPTNYQTAHPDHSNKLNGSDLYYSTVDGTDYYPDFFLGRLSVDTLAQTETVVNKIINYERNAPVNANYYTDTSLVQLFEDVDNNPGDGVNTVDGRENATFRIIEFAEEINTLLTDNNYNTERIYDQSGNFAQGPLRYEDNTALPNNLTIAGGFPWNGTTADITNALNGGNFLVAYDGHGSATSWGQPNFQNANITALTNGNMTPVVFSLACMTGWFDNETDDAALNTANNRESFCEEFLRKDNSGAAAVIGSTRISWDMNDFMMLGMYKAIWPDFDPAPPLRNFQLPGIESGPLYKMGQINTFSKLYMANCYNHSNYRQLSFEMYHLFGDPEMPIWTAQPSTFKVSHPKGIGSVGHQDFIVTVTNKADDKPVPNAMVALTRDGNIVGTQETDAAGNARFTFNNPGVGKMDITVTTHNFRPYEGNIIVNAGGAVINRLDPDNAMENTKVKIGGTNFSGNEAIKVYLGDKLVLNKTASSGSFGQLGVENTEFTVPPAHPLGPVNVIAQGTTSDRYAVDVFQVRSANPLDLYTYSQWDSTTWGLSSGDNPTWNNPEIQLYDTSNNPVASNNLTAGRTYIIKAKIHNDTAFDAKGAKVTFKWANFGVGQPDIAWNVIGTDDLDIPAHSVKEAEIRWTPAGTGHLCVMADIYHIEDINTANNKGQENCHVGPTSSPATVSFTMWNTTNKPAAMHFELRQLTNTGSLNTRLWASKIIHPDPQILQPGERREAKVVIDPDKTDIKQGQTAEFALTGYLNGKICGGVNFIITKR
jgi:hypothetical protein